jgi:hypothetical protein
MHEITEHFNSLLEKNINYIRELYNNYSEKLLITIGHNLSKDLDSVIHTPYYKILNLLNNIENSKLLIIQPYHQGTFIFYSFYNNIHPKNDPIKSNMDTYISWFTDSKILESFENSFLEFSRKNHGTGRTDFCFILKLVVKTIIDGIVVDPEAPIKQKKSIEYKENANFQEFKKMINKDVFPTLPETYNIDNANDTGLLEFQYGIPPKPYDNDNASEYLELFEIIKNSNHVMCDLSNIIFTGVVYEWIRSLINSLFIYLSKNSAPADKIDKSYRLLKKIAYYNTKFFKICSPQLIIIATNLYQNLSNMHRVIDPNPKMTLHNLDKHFTPVINKISHNYKLYDKNLKSLFLEFFSFSKEIIHSKKLIEHLRHIYTRTCDVLGSNNYSFNMLFWRSLLDEEINIYNDDYTTFDFSTNLENYKISPEFKNNGPSQVLVLNIESNKSNLTHNSVDYGKIYYATASWNNIMNNPYISAKKFKNDLYSVEGIDTFKKFVNINYQKPSEMYLIVPKREYHPVVVHHNLSPILYHMESPEKDTIFFKIMKTVFKITKSSEYSVVKLILNLLFKIYGINKNVTST